METAGKRKYTKHRYASNLESKDFATLKRVLLKEVEDAIAREDKALQVAVIDSKKAEAVRQYVAGMRHVQRIILAELEP